MQKTRKGETGIRRRGSGWRCSIELVSKGVAKLLLGARAGISLQEHPNLVPGVLPRASVRLTGSAEPQLSAWGARCAGSWRDGKQKTKKEREGDVLQQELVVLAP